MFIIKSPAPVAPATNQPHSPPPLALLGLGFRPFFLSAGIAALLFLPLWIVFYHHPAMIPAHWYYPAPVFWHGHEMLWGYTVAVISGFLLTAVGNWTGTVVIQGWGLAGLALLWWAGRLVIFLPLPPALIAIVDVSFIPVLIAVLARPLIQKKNYAQIPILIVLLLLAVANGLFHAQLLGWTTDSARLAQHGAIYGVMLLIVIIGGRVMPFFTERGLPASAQYQARQWPWLERILIPFTALSLFSLLLWPQTAWPGYLVLLTALAQTVRWTGWYHAAVWSVPLLWVLYTGYGWLIIGLVLTGISHIGWFAGQFLALHAFTTGAIGVMTLGMMARVSLGHTGRIMKAHRLTHLAFIVLNLAAITRVILAGLWPAHYLVWLILAASLWALGFGLFLGVYGVMLMQPRIDGRPG